MQLPPPSVIASWPTPNYVNPETRGHLGMVVGLLLSGLVTITLAIRLYARKWLTRGFALDDIFILLAYFPTTAFTIIGVVAEESLQWNRHSWDVEKRFIVPGLQLTLANEMLFDLATNLLKLSILTQLYRLMAATSARKMTIAVLVLMAIISLDFFAFIMVSILQCTPLSTFWELSPGPQNCINQNAHLIATNIINTVTDWVVVILPIGAVLNLSLPTKQLSIIIVLFGVGILASSAGIARTYFSWMLTVNYDSAWIYWLTWFCSAIELNLGIICASIPATKPFFANYLPNLFETTIRARSWTIDWERKPLTHSQSFTTFIDQSSSSTFLPRQPTPLHTHHRGSDLNKPLPPILYDQHTGLEKQPERYAEPRFHSSLTGSPLWRREGVRFSDNHGLPAQSNLQALDRATILIMYRGDSDQGPIRQLPIRASTN
ncbi:uncharacterized protein F4822DRAFT_25823 [Hypoxylon trugodes]|uniref:uncharacterized protein n=1 Tax=Hypoxylon trugodes TaxID=326681 RepID=UPI00219C7570|nr:uncharacterized protein F4822DRAFT_25823 [Hypoxylon trugodes]KAI1393800.1 integral membrane protein [Hypoxylon trugodes]